MSKRRKTDEQAEYLDLGRSASPCAFWNEEEPTFTTVDKLLIEVQPMGITDNSNRDTSSKIDLHKL